MIKYKIYRLTHEWNGKLGIFMKFRKETFSSQILEAILESFL